MSIIRCNACEEIIDTDFNYVFYHDDGDIFCSDCAESIGFEEGVNGHYG